AGANGATLELSRGTLEILSESTVEGDLLLSNGTLKLLADLVMEGDTAWRSGSIEGTATFVNQGTMTLDTDQGSNPRTLSGNLRNEATIVMEGSKTNGLGTTPTARLVNAAGATFEVRGVPGIKSGGGTTTPAFDNHGTLKKVSAGESFWTGAEVNHLGGKTEVLEGVLILGEGSESTGGVWEVASGAVLELGWQTREIELVGLYQGSGDGIVRLAGGEFFAIGAAGATFDYPD